MKNNMTLCKAVAIGLLSFSTVSVTSLASAQDSLVELLRAGNRDAVLSALQTPGVDVDAAEPDGSTALLWATYQVDHELVRSLLDKGAKADITNRYGSSPLTEAVKINDVDLVRMLLEAGADANSPNQDNQTALMLAASVGSYEIAKLLLEHGADVNAVEQFRGQTALMWAADGNHPEVAELLVEHGADVSVRAVYDDWQRQMTSEPRAQFRATGGLTALLYATRSGCLRCAKAIVEAGADINKPNPDGITPLLNAIDSRSFDVAMYLIDKGANVHVWDMHGRTPIYMAVDMNSFTPRGFFGFGGGPAVSEPQQYTAMDIVNRLLEMGVDVNHQMTRIRPNGPGRGRFADYDMRGGTTATQIAAMNHDTEALQALLTHGANPNIANVFKITPLMYAAGMSATARRGGFGGGPGSDPQAQAIATIDLLLDAGADINAQITDSHTFTAKLDTYVQGLDQEGRTALFGAAQLGWNKVVEHLLARGADPMIRDASGQTALDIVVAAQEAASAQPQGPGAAGAGRTSTIDLLRGRMPAGDSTVD